MNKKTVAGIAIALATLMASPAFAQVRHSPHRSWDVYNTNGRYVGSDPDPNVREMIARDRAEQANGGY
jgi:hypothetical protein